MNQSVKYQQNAAECYEMAQMLSDPGKKTKMLAMAQSWKSLADFAANCSSIQARSIVEFMTQVGA